MTMEQTPDAVSAKALDMAKFQVKQALAFTKLPSLPEFVEERLFLQGRSAWTYKYSDLQIEEAPTSKQISFIIEALLKREFHAFAKPHRYKFLAQCGYVNDTHAVKVKKLTAIREGD
jgi:hypothetical protein